MNGQPQHQPNIIHASDTEAGVEQSLMRAPEIVMRLQRMGASFPTRLSFMRQLVRLMQREAWSISTTRFDLDENGFGVAVYRAQTPARSYSLIAFSHDLPADKRTDRVIAEAWDTTFALFNGEPGEADIKRLSGEVPRQEAGRCSPQELVLARANKSVRLFEHTVERLANGRQPDLTMLSSVGYLARTTAVYGNGKYGIADRERLLDHPHMAAPFRAEMLAVYLIRSFMTDLAEHIARHRNPAGFVPLERNLKRMLGIGNSTGLGMAPFLVTHPHLVHNWVAARETALARVRALPVATSEDLARFSSLLARARQHVAEWEVIDDIQMRRIEVLRTDLAQFAAWSVEQIGQRPQSFWNAAYEFADGNLSLEACELVASLLVEPHGALVDDLGETMSAGRGDDLRPGMTVKDLAALIDTSYGWALQIDPDAAGAFRFFWYVSEEKLEPRLGERQSEDGMERETPLIIFRDVQNLRAALEDFDRDEPLALFLFRKPEHRHCARRVLGITAHPYGEIRDNLAGSAMRPIDLLRFKLAFFGASKFDPKSDRWTRITMYQGAPLPDELQQPDADDWSFSVWPGQPVQAVKEISATS